MVFWELNDQETMFVSIIFEFHLEFCNAFFLKHKKARLQNASLNQLYKVTHQMSYQKLILS